MNNAFFSFSIRTWLAALAVLAALPALWLGWRASQEQFRVAEEAAWEKTASLAGAVAVTQERFTAKALGMAKTISVLPELERRETAALEDIFRSLLAANPEFGNILVVDPDGSILASAKPHPPMNLAGRRHVRLALEKKGFVGGEYVFSEASGGPVFPYALAVQNADGAVRALVVVSVNLEACASLARALQAPAGLSLGLLDHSGRRLMRHPDDPARKGLGDKARPEILALLERPETHGRASVAYPDGERWLLSYRKLTLPGESEAYMTVVSGLPRDIALAQALWEHRLGMVLSPLAAVFTVCLAMLLGEFAIARPLEGLGRDAGRIARGGLPAPAGGSSGPKELRGLSRSFQAMAMALRQRDEKRRRVVEALRSSRTRFKDIAKSMSDWIWEIDASGAFTYAGGKVADIIGYCPAEIRGRHYLDFLTPEERPRAQVFTEERMKDAQPIHDFVSWHTAKDGRKICLKTNGVAFLDPSGVLLGYRGACEDVTVQELAKEQLLRSLREKEVLLKEVHHRVKNNLQIISSLLSLESQHFDDPRVAQAFEQMRGRVRSIAMIHETLYGSEDFAAVDMSRYIERLTRSLKDAFALPERRVELVLDLEHLAVPLDRALPVSLLVNEMTANAFKHAFDGQTQGTVRVRLARVGADVELRVSDDGTGLPLEVLSGERRGLGLQLIEALTAQLGGQAFFPETNGGTTVMARFPVNGG